MRARVGGNIGVPLSAQVEDSTPDTVHVVEVEQLPAGDDRYVSPVDRGVAQLLAGSPRSAPDVSRRTPQPRRASSRTRSRRLGGRELRRPCSVGDCAAARSRRRCRLRAGSPGWGHGRGGRDRGAARSWRERRCCRSRRCACLDATCSSDVLAASAIGRLAGADAEGITTPCAGSPDSSTRWSWSATIGGVRFVNDSKATNIESARRSVESVDPGWWRSWAAGYKGGDFGDLLEPLRARAGGGRRHRRGARRASRTRSAESVPVHARSRWMKRSARRSRWRRRATRWCLRPRARASTCSRLRGARAPSRRPWRGSASERRGA